MLSYRVVARDTGDSKIYEYVLNISKNLPKALPVFGCRKNGHASSRKMYWNVYESISGNCGDLD